MNISFFLTPKNDVVCGLISSSMRQIIEKMEFHRYTAIPLLDEGGRYVGTITEGDILWKLKEDNNYDVRKLEHIYLNEVPRHITNVPVSIDANIEDLILASTSQNFVPVVDDQGIFIGIIKRGDIISYCYKLLQGQGVIGNKTALRAGA